MNRLSVFKRLYRTSSELISTPKSLWNNVRILEPHILSKGEDKYRWMEKYGKHVIRRLNEEDTYCSDVLHCCSSINSRLVDEIESYYDVDYMDLLPAKINGYVYYSKEDTMDGIPKLSRKRVGSEEEETLLDLNKEFSGRAFSLHSIVLSGDNRYIAYTVDTSGKELYNLYIKDIRSGNIEVIARNVYSVAFGLNHSDEKGPYEVYYTVANSLMRTDRIYRHILGTSLSHDELIYEDMSGLFYCDIKRTKDCKYMIISSSTQNTTEQYVKGGVFKKPTLLFQRHENEECYTEHILDFFVVVKRSHDAKMDVFLVHENDMKNYMELETESENGLIDSCFRDGAFIQLTPHESKREETDYFRVIDMDTMKNDIILYEKNCEGYQVHSVHLDLYDNQLKLTESYLPIPHLGDFIIGQNLDINNESVLYTLSNPLKPGETFEYNIKENSSKRVYSSSLPSSSIHEEDYIIQNRYISTSDHDTVPVTLIHKRTEGLDIPKETPMLLSSYGCYGVENNASYHPPYLSLLRRGWVLGYPFIRGGGERGHQWYTKGKGKQRMNGVIDLNTVVGTYASSHPVCLSTNSAGSIIVGALLNITKYPISSVLFHVPFLLLKDTLNNPSLPLTVTEYNEWGNPSIPEEASIIESICPYTNIKKRKYPNIFISCGIKDQRAPYYNTLKYINRIREYNQDKQTAQIMRCYEGGHFTENDPQLRIMSAAEQLAFLIHSVKGDVI